MAKLSLKKNKKAQEEDEEEEDEEEEGEEGEEGDDEENGLENLPKEMIRRINALSKLHVEYTEVEAAYKVERIALERKFLELKKVAIDKRTKIVSGEVDVPVDPAGK